MQTRLRLSLLLAGASMLFAAVSARADDVPMRLGPGPHLLLDDFYIENQSDVSRVIQRPSRLPHPVITGPEDKCFQPYVTVLNDAQRDVFRAWYGIPESATQSHLAYMESADGIHWIRPHRVLPDPGPIQFGVSILDEGPQHPDRERRYKYGWWHDGGLRVAGSPDGLRWTPMSDRPVLAHNHDINCIFRDPIRKRYLAMCSIVRSGPNWEGMRRIPHQSVSRDLLHWTDPWPVVMPDEKDEGDTQFYCMGGLLTRGELLIGMLRVLRDDLPADPGGSVAGVGYTTLAWSRDGWQWRRDREPFLPRNPKAGSWDHAMSWADCQLVVANETYIYYGGYARGHKVERFAERQIGLARMPLDRYVARAASKEEGRLRLRPAMLEGKSLTLNAEVTGRLAVRVLDSEGRPLSGFDWEDCSPIRGDSVSHAVKWRGGLLPSGRCVQLEFSLQDARLYAFSLLP